MVSLLHGFEQEAAECLESTATTVVVVPEICVEKASETKEKC